MIKKLSALILLILCSVMFSGYRKPDVTEINAVRNSNIHNNLGTMYMNEKVYYAAIQEFKIAISLNPESQASAVYYDNLGYCYMQIGYPDLAQDCFERALKLYSLNMRYYVNLAKCYIDLGIKDKKLAEYKDFKNPYNRLMSGVLYAESGDYKRGITILDEFTISEPDLIITPAVKAYIKSSVKKMNDELPETLQDTLKSNKKK